MSVQYDLYLEQHKGNVLKGLRWIQENLPDIAVGAVEWQIEFAHDESKSHSDEYEAYDAYFYGGNRSYKVVQDFNKAWLLHIHRNPHHWQYWVLIHDDPDEDMTILDMPYNYILEMICDWWSFSWQKKNLYEVFDWYNEHKDYIKLSDKTRKTVEEILNAIKDKLTENTYNAEFMHHGVKGQKWGVQNGPPYPIDRSQNHDTIVRDAIASGQVSKTINPEKQKRHTKDGHQPGRSYIDGDLEYAQELVDEYSGKGIAIMDRHGKWTNKEKFDHTEIIGTHVDIDGTENRTNKGVITYSKTGAHVYPRKEKK